jgi:hypothetical protein
MALRGVIRHEVEQDPQPPGVRLVDEHPGSREVAEERIDVPVVGDVVSAIGHRRRVPRIDPEPVDAEVDEVVEVPADAVDVPHAIAVGIGEAPDIDLIDDGVPPPRVRSDGRHAPQSIGRSYAAEMASGIPVSIGFAAGS